MADRLIKSETLQDIADAIRTKTGSEDAIKTSDFATKIASIIKPSGHIVISTEGVHDVTPYAEVVTTNMIPSTPGVRYLANACVGIGTATETEIVLAHFEGSMPISFISHDAFAGNTDITSVIIPEGYTVVDDSAFKDCTALSYVQLPKTLASIASNVFEGCTELRSIALPHKSTISSKLFSGCTSLSNVLVPEGVNYIGKEAFYNCISLKCLCLPSTITSIGENAFLKSAVITIYFAGSAAQWDAISFGTQWHGGKVQDVWCGSNGYYVHKTIT